MDKTPAIIGLCGVLVGSAISAGTNWLLAVRRESAEAKQNEINRANSVKLASRLIMQELLIAETTASRIVKNRRLSYSATELKVDEWKKNKEVIASVLSLADWLTISNSINYIIDLKTVISTKPEFSEIPDEIIPLIRDVCGGITEGRAILTRYLEGIVP